MSIYELYRNGEDAGMTVFAPSSVQRQFEADAREAGDFSEALVEVKVEELDKLIHAPRAGEAIIALADALEQYGSSDAA